jgi:VCBS repeat-containing protein
MFSPLVIARSRPGHALAACLSLLARSVIVIGALALTGATGQVVTANGPYTVLRYTTGGTFTVPANVTSVEYVIVGGGGGGGGNRGGGGGAGGVRFGAATVVPGATYSVVVGLGGAEASSGSASSVGFPTPVVAAGGGAGGHVGLPGSSGGSGGGNGGGTTLSATTSSPVTTPAQGSAGALGSTAGSYGAGGGGGGYSGAGGNGIAGSAAALSNTGGAGYTEALTGLNLKLAGGGGGGVQRSGDSTVGGAAAAGFGGGNGSGANAPGGAGTPGTGGGGGGGGSTVGGVGGPGGAGGSGIVILRYLVPSSAIVATQATAAAVSAYGFIDLIETTPLPAGVTVVGVDLSVEYSTYWPPTNPAFAGHPVTVNGAAVGSLYWESLGNSNGWTAVQRSYRGPLASYVAGAANTWRITSDWNPVTLRNITLRVYFLPDVAAPTLTSVAIASTNTDPSFARPGDTVTVTFTGSEPLGTVASAALRGWYPLDGDRHDPTLTGPSLSQPGTAVPFVSGLSGQAVSLDGTSANYLRAAINASGDVNPTFTWGAWVKLNNTTAWSVPFSNDNTPWDRFVSSFNGLWSVSKNGHVSSGIASTTAWTFIAQTFNGTNQSLYVDGNAAFTTAEPGLVPMHPHIDIGRNADAATGFNGVIDGAFFFDDALTAGQIAAIRAGGPGGSGVLALAGRTVVATIAGRPAAVTRISGNTWRATQTLTASDPAGPVTFALNYTDTVGNAGPTVTGPTDGSSVIFDPVKPALPATSYQLVYETVTPTRVTNGIVYSVDRAAELGDLAFSRVKYRMEVTTGGVPRYADASFDRWPGLTVAQLAVPSPIAPAVIQRNVTNLTVASNYPGVVNGAVSTGRLELWDRDYYPDADAGIGGSTTTYDFDDRIQTFGTWGSFQVHNLGIVPAQTVLAWNNHGSNAPEIGFGNSPGPHPDWTFSETASLGVSNWKLQIAVETVSIPSSFAFTEDVAGPIRFYGTPFTDPDSAALTVTLSVADGALTAQPGNNLTLGGTATARTLTGSVADLNAYFTTAGRITYQGALNNTATRTLTVAVTDGTNSASTTRPLTFTPVPEAPTLAAIALSGAEDTPLAFTASAFTGAFSDVDGDTLASITIATLPAAGTLKLSGTAVVANQTISAAQLAQLVYEPASNDHGARTFTVSASDGVLSSAVATVTVTLAAANDAPISAAPATATVAEDVSLAFTGPLALSVSDVDGNLATARLIATQGTVAVSLAGGATLTSGTNASSTLTVSGTAAQLNAALATAVFTPTADFHGNASLTLLATDSLSLSASASVALTISPVADIAADTLTTSEDAAGGINALANDSFENSGAQVTAITQPSQGLAAFTAGGLLTYTPAPDFAGTDSFTYTVTSAGVTETATVSVTVSAINDGPLLQAPAEVTSDANTPIVFSAANDRPISVYDSDSGASALTMSLQATNGVLTLATTSGLTFAIGDGTADASLVLSGSLAALNQAFAGLVFAPTPGFSGSASLVLSISDNGHSGAGGAQTAAATVAITVRDTIPPTVLSLASLTANGHYRAGAVIDVTVLFSEPVVVDVAGGAPTILLETGNTDRTATYVSFGSDTATLVFRYTVAAGDTSADLNHASIAALQLNGATIRDAANNAANLTLPATTPGTLGALATNTALVIDTTAPTIALSSPSVASTGSGPVTFTVTFADANLSAATLSPDHITLQSTLADPRLTAPSASIAVSGTGATRTVTLSSISGDGMLRILVAEGTATDVAGNAAPAAGPSALVTVQNTFPVQIVTPPAARTVAVGMPLQLGVEVSGTAPTYQWFKDTELLLGATQSTYALAATPLDAVGSYTVAVGNVLGSVTSPAAAVNVFDVTATHSAVGPGYVAGQILTLRHSLVFTGGDGTFVWSLLLPPQWSYAGGDSDAESRPAVGATDLVEWAWRSFPLSPVTFTAQLRVPADATGPAALAAQVAFTRTGTTVPLLARPDPLIVSEITTHSADTDANGRFKLTELLRVVELYNVRHGTLRTGAYAPARGTEDGFAPDLLRASAAPAPLPAFHSADTDRDGSIGLLELTRVIELFNYRAGTVRTGEHHRRAGTEDGYAPGPAAP